MCQGEPNHFKISNHEENHQDNMKKKDVYILAIDGGGIRGLIPATILKNLEEELGGPISSYFDLIAGTSTGGLLALGLNVIDPETGGAKYSAKEIGDIYLEDGKQIFKTSYWRKIKTVFGLYGPKYSRSRIAKVTQKYYGDSTLKDTITNTLIPSYDISRDAPLNFMSSKANADPKKHNYLMRNVAQGASAAPSIFKPLEMTNEEGEKHIVVDGGFMSNNPTTAALVHAQELYPNAERFHLLSLGTGRNINPLDKNTDGLAEWLPNLVEYVLDSGAEEVNLEMEHLFKAYQKSEFHRNSTYLRVQCEVERAIVDDVSESNLKTLQQSANEQYKKQSSEIAAFAAMLKKSKEKKPSFLKSIFKAFK